MCTLCYKLLAFLVFSLCPNTAGHGWLGVESRGGWGSHLWCSFPSLLGHAQVLQAEASLVALGTHPARLVVQGLGALCADGLQSQTKKPTVQFSTGFTGAVAPLAGSAPSPRTHTAPQDLQWCLRLVKLKLSLQPLHVCFSLSFFLELFWSWKKKDQKLEVFFYFFIANTLFYKPQHG